MSRSGPQDQRNTGWKTGRLLEGLLMLAHEARGPYKLVVVFKVSTIARFGLAGG